MVVHNNTILKIKNNKLEKFLLEKALNNTPYKLFFDGCVEPFNPGGKAGCGFIITYKNKIIAYKSIFIANKTIKDGSLTTNNIAEWLGLIYALKTAAKLKIKNIVAFGDSQLVINQINGTYKCKKLHLLAYLQQASTLKNSFNNIKFFWLPRELNTIADAISKQAVQNYTPKPQYIVKTVQK